MKEITATNSLIWAIDAAKHFFVDYSNEEYKKLFIEMEKIFSYDNTSHNGGFWKAAKKLEQLYRKHARHATLNELLEYIGK